MFWFYVLLRFSFWLFLLYSVVFVNVLLSFWSTKCLPTASLGSHPGQLGKSARLSLLSKVKTIKGTVGIRWKH